MNIFLVDLENVQSSCFKGFDTLDEDDEIYFFYSANSKMYIDNYNELHMSRCSYKFQKINTGVRNALDFQLVEYLGYLIGINEKYLDNIDFWIVSKDKGFQIVVGNIEGANIRCCINFAKEVDEVSAITSQSTDISLKAEILKALPNLHENQVNMVIHCMKNAKDLSELNNQLQAHIGDKTFKNGQEIQRIYKGIKSIFKQIKK